MKNDWQALKPPSTISSPSMPSGRPRSISRTYSFGMSLPERAVASPLRMVQRMPSSFGLASTG